MSRPAPGRSGARSAAWSARSSRTTTAATPGSPASRRRPWPRTASAPGPGRQPPQPQQVSLPAQLTRAVRLARVGVIDLAGGRPLRNGEGEGGQELRRPRRRWRHGSSGGGGWRDFVRPPYPQRHRGEDLFHSPSSARRCRGCAVSPARSGGRHSRRRCPWAASSRERAALAGADAGDGLLWRPQERRVIMEYLVTMTTRVPDGRQSKPSPTSAPARPPARASSRPRGTCCGCGARRCGRANGAPSGTSPPPTTARWKRSSPRCRCGYGGRTRSRRSRPPSDPVPPPPPGPPEFLTTFTLTIPEGTPAREVDDTDAREADSARELGRQGHLLRLWRLPPGGPGRWACGGQGRRRDAGDPGVAAVVVLDDRADHAADRAPERPGAGRDMKRDGRRVGWGQRSSPLKICRRTGRRSGCRGRSTRPGTARRHGPSRSAAAGNRTW